MSLPEHLMNCQILKLAIPYIVSHGRPFRKGSTCFVGIFAIDSYVHLKPMISELKLKILFTGHIPIKIIFYALILRTCDEIVEELTKYLEYLK